MQIFWVLASAIPIIIAGLIILSALFFKTSRGFCLAGLVCIGELANNTLKHIFRIPRPEGACATTFGFPSGHSAFAAMVVTW